MSEVVLHQYIKNAESGRRIGAIIGKRFKDNTVVITYSKCHARDRASYKNEAGKRACNFNPEEMIGRAVDKANAIHSNAADGDKIRAFNKNFAKRFISRCEGYFKDAEKIIIGFPV